MPKQVVIYVHGFKSSARAQKSVLTKEYIQNFEPDVVFDAHDLPDHPKTAFDEMSKMVKEYIDKGYRVSLIGSSMGGFCSIYLSAKFNIKAVLINPCVYPWNLIPKLLGKQSNPFTGAEFEVTMDQAEDTKKIASMYNINPRLLAMYLQRGDEVLPYQDSASLLHDAAIVHIEDGGSHRYDGFEKHLPEMMNFLLN